MPDIQLSLPAEEEYVRCLADMEIARGQLLKYRLLPDPRNRRIRAETA